ncbi:MAG: type III pantothenate kinase [Ruminococcaceae bacterium]|nr:type III pantothenate kinase [Oscillospiraceae bacterium]
MILAINIGNTHISFGLSDGATILEPVMDIKTDRLRTHLEYASQMKQILELCGFDVASIDGAVISSVVPPMTHTVKKAVKSLTGLDALVVGAGVKSGIHILTDDPGTVASDLVATAVVAKEEYALPCVIVDMGTATTLTVVDEKGRFIGGSIMPGVNVSSNALSEGASLLPKIDLAEPKKAIGSATVDCMRSGLVYGYAGAVDGIIDRFADELGREPATIVTTGGVAEFVCSYSKRTIRHDKNMLLKGLCYIYNKNKKISN